MAISMRVRAIGAPSTRAVGVARPRTIAVRAIQAEGVTTTEAIKKAEEICGDGDLDACKAAWDEVEQARAAEEFQIKRRMAMMRNASEDACAKGVAQAAAALTDPLEQFCAESPDADECRVYED